MLLDNKGRLWIATDGAGVIRIPEKDIPLKSKTLTDFELFDNVNQLSDDYVMSMIQSASGDIWLGYWDKGLDRYDPGTNTFHHYLVTEDLSVNFQEYPIVHLAETQEPSGNYLWLGTRGGGVYQLKFDEARNRMELVNHFYANPEVAGTLSNDFTNDFLVDSKGDSFG